MIQHIQRFLQETHIGILAVTCRIGLDQWMFLVLRTGGTVDGKNPANHPGNYASP